MICKHCNSKIPEESIFCPICGSRIETQTQNPPQTYCSFCRKPFKPDAEECEYCGNTKRITLGQKKAEEPSGKIASAYFINILATIFILIVRFSIQVTVKIGSLLQNRYYLGIDPDVKPLVTGVPVIVAVIVAILLAKDRAAPKEKKTVAIIINTLIIVLSLFIIWFDIPKALFD